MHTIPHIHKAKIGDLAWFDLSVLDTSARISSNIFGKSLA